MRLKSLKNASLLALGLFLGFFAALKLFESANNYFIEQEKTLGYQDYLAEGTCDEPMGGCGYDYYWDFNTCSCEPYDNTSGCEEPPGGCGEGWYWDQGACACNYDNSSSCDPPSEGCGMNHYWDSGSCSCVYDSSSGCTEPTGGCGWDWFWNYDICTCEPKESTCTEPAEGCVEANYWDPESCSCIWAGNPDCQEPAGGCGYEYYWEYSSCSCIYYGGSSGCTMPSGGCGEGYYWNDYFCRCKPHGDYGEGGQGGYPEGEGPYDSPYEYEENFDRLAYESEETLTCVRSILTSSEYEQLRYLIGATDTERQLIHSLGEKVMSCWGDDFYKDEYRTAVGEYSPLENEQCLIDGLGISAYEEIYKGLREPTYEEHLWFERCYGNVQNDAIMYVTSNQELPGEVESCLKNVLTNDLYEKVKSGQIDVPYEYREKIDRCFGIDPQPFEEGHSYELPDDIKGCLIEAVGESRFSEINAGLSEPTEEEKVKGEYCFDQLHEDQAKFLPLPPEQIPYLELDEGAVGFSGVKQDTKKVGSKLYGGKVVFSGKGPPNSVVTIYIYSEPIVVVTKTDENGDWIYELNKPLEGERHVAYATIKSEDGNIVRSSVFNFQVVAASAEELPTLLEESEASSSTTKFIRYAIGIIIFAALVAIGGMSYTYLKKFKLAKLKAEKQLAGRFQGQSKSEDTPSSIN